MSMCNALPARLPLCLAGQCSPLMGTVPTGVQISPSLSLVESQFTVLAMATSAPDTKASTLPLKRPSAPGSLSRTHTGTYMLYRPIHPPIHPSTHSHQPSPPRFLTINVSRTVSALRAAPVSGPTDHPTPSQAFARPLHSLP